MINPIRTQGKYLWRGRGPILWGLGQNVNRILATLQNGRTMNECKLDGRVAQVFFERHAYDCNIRFSGVRDIKKVTLKKALRFAFRGDYDNKIPYLLDDQFLFFHDGKDITIISHGIYKRDRTLSGIVHIGNKNSQNKSELESKYREVHRMISKFILGLKSLCPKGKGEKLPKKIKQYVTLKIAEEQNNRLFKEYLEKLLSLENEFKLFEASNSSTINRLLSQVRSRKKKFRYLVKESYIIIKIYKRAGLWKELHDFICEVVGQRLEKLGGVNDAPN